MKTNLDLELLRSIVAFADSGSFKLAAQLVYRSPSAISMQMRRLEALVGQPLFARRGRDLVFTDRGMQLALQARQLLAFHDSVVDEAQGKRIQGKVRVGMPDDYAMMLLPKILSHLAAHYPGLPLDVVANTSPKLRKLLEAGELDLAVLATDNPRKEDVILGRERIVWVGAAHQEKPELHPLRLALFSDESPIYRATIASLSDFKESEGKPVEIEIALRSSSWSVLTAAAAVGYAIATMAHSVVVPGLRVLGLDDGFPDLGHIFLVMRRTPDSQSIATSRLADEILESFRLPGAIPSTHPSEDPILRSISSALPAA